MAKLTPEKFKLKDGREVLLKSPEPDEWHKMRDFVNHIKVESKNTYQFPGQPELQEEATRNRIKTAAESKKRMIVDAEFEGRFVAQMDFMPMHHIEDHPWISHNTSFGMTVIQEFWGQGIAKKLLEILDIEAKRLGYKNIHAKVREHNERGIKLYTNAGFEITGKEKNFAFQDGKYYSDLLIFKEVK
jgi:RimJ/RimL family protein N-acetyltransferase